MYTYPIISYHAVFRTFHNPYSDLESKSPKGQWNAKCCQDILELGSVPWSADRGVQVNVEYMYIMYEHPSKETFEEG